MAAPQGLEGARPAFPWRVLLVLFAAVGLGAAAGLLLAGQAAPPQHREISIFARQYAFDPPVIHANRGDTLHLKLVSLDVTHGFYLEGHDIDAEILPQQKAVRVRHPSKGNQVVEQEEIVVVADTPGKFRYRCSHTCGALHPFMSGELIVAPNHLLHAGIGSTVGLLAGFVLLVAPKRRASSEVANG